MKKVEVKAVICMLVYNQSEYIKDTLDSILNQKTIYNYKILIHDDCSTDGTTEMLKEYESKFPEKITLILEKENQFSKGSYRILSSPAMLDFKAEYVFIAEGDDIWIDLCKIQRQIDYMETHKECLMSVHNAVVINQENGNISLMNLIDKDTNIEPDEIILKLNGNLHTSSYCSRADIYRDFWRYGDEFFFDLLPVGDYPYELYVMRRGEIHFIDRVMTAYRFGTRESWSSSQKNDVYTRIITGMKMIVFLINYDNYSLKKYSKEITLSIQMRVSDIIYELMNLGCEERNKMIKRVEDTQSPKCRELISLITKELNNDFREIKRTDKHNYIFGTGKFACALKKELEKNNIPIEGCLVFDEKQNESDFGGIKVWSVSKLPCDINNIRLWIGVSNYTVYKNESIKNMIDNYRCEKVNPFSIKFNL